MKRETFIENFVAITRQRLEKILPETATEGFFMFKAYNLVSRCLRHIIANKLITEERQ